MSGQSGTGLGSYANTIQGLKLELQGHIAKLKSAIDWPDFERLYRALCTVEELASAPKTTLEELLGILPANTPNAAPQNSSKKSSLELGEQVETEPATEIEKGS